MSHIHTKRRSAFSLLEMVLALSIAMLLLLALYLTLSTQVMHAQIGRDTLAEGEVARSILTRITNDVVNQLGAVDPRSFPVYETPVDPAATTDPAAAPAMPMATTETGTAVTFNYGISGDATSLKISSYRVQKPLDSSDTSAVVENCSDLRCVFLWLVNNGGDTSGLARHEVKQATGTLIDSEPIDLPDQEKHIFAKEVTNIQFEYFDGTSWQTEWDGNAAAGEDGTSRVGPPAAIKVTITLRKYNDPIQAAAAGDNDQGPTYSRIIALPTSNNFPAPTTTP